MTDEEFKHLHDEELRLLNLMSDASRAVIAAEKAFRKAKYQYQDAEMAYRKAKADRLNTAT